MFAHIRANISIILPCGQKSRDSPAIKDLIANPANVQFNDHDWPVIVDELYAIVRGYPARVVVVFLNGNADIDPIPQSSCCRRVLLKNGDQSEFFRAFAADSDTKHPLQKPSYSRMRQAQFEKLGGTHDPEAHVFGELPRMTRLPSGGFEV